MDMSTAIDEFLAGVTFAVVGASNERSKYGNKVLRCYLQNGRVAHPINPNHAEVEGLVCYATLTELSEPVHGVSIITPPHVTEQVVVDAHAAGIERLWMQPGAQSSAAIEHAQELGMSIIAGGPCLLVALGYRE